MSGWDGGGIDGLTLRLGETTEVEVDALLGLRCNCTGMMTKLRPSLATFPFRGTIDQVRHSKGYKLS